MELTRLKCPPSSAVQRRYNIVFVTFSKVVYSEHVGDIHRFFKNLLSVYDLFVRYRISKIENFICSGSMIFLKILNRAQKN